MCIPCICIWWCNVRDVYSLYLYLVVQWRMSFPGQRIAQWVRGRDPQPALPPIEPRFQLSAFFVFSSQFCLHFWPSILLYLCLLKFLLHVFLYLSLYSTFNPWLVSFISICSCAAFPRIMIWFSSHRYHHAAISEIDKKSVRWRRDHHCAQMAPFNARLEYSQPSFLPCHVVIQAMLAVPYC